LSSVVTTAVADWWWQKSEDCTSVAGW